MFIAIFHMAGERFVDWIPVDVFQMDDIKSTKQSNRAQQAATCEKWNLLFKPPLCPWCMKNRRTPNKNHMWIFRIFIRRNKMLRRCHDKMNNKPAEKKFKREVVNQVRKCQIVCAMYFSFIPSQHFGRGESLTRKMFTASITRNNVIRLS